MPPPPFASGDPGPGEFGDEVEAPSPLLLLLFSSRSAADFGESCGSGDDDGEGVFVLDLLTDEASSSRFSEREPRMRTLAERDVLR